MDTIFHLKEMYVQMSISVESLNCDNDMQIIFQLEHLFDLYIIELKCKTSLLL